MSDEEASAADKVPALAQIVPGRAIQDPDATFWTRESRAPADLVESIEKAAGLRIILTGKALIDWTEDLHFAYARLVSLRPSKDSEKAEPSEGERLQNALAGANTLVGDLLGFISTHDPDMRQTAYEAARALAAFRMAAEAAQRALTRPGPKTKTLREHLVADLLALYRRGFGSEPPRTRGGPATRFVSTMFVAAGVGHRSDDALYNIRGHARRPRPRKD